MIIRFTIIQSQSYHPKYRRWPPFGMKLRPSFGGWADAFGAPSPTIRGLECLPNGGLGLNLMTRLANRFR
jgi:hypothetical protein